MFITKGKIYMTNYFKNDKVKFFAFGVLAATAGVKFLKSKVFRDGCVNVLASGMKVRDEASASLEKIREDAQDICFDAKMASEDKNAE